MSADPCDGGCAGSRIVCRRARADPDDGRRRHAAGAGGAIFAGIRAVFAADHRCFRSRQLSAHLRQDPRQHAAEYFYVCGQRRAGICVFVCVSMGHLGRGAGNLHRDAGLHAAGVLSVCAGKNAAAVLPAAVFCVDDPKNHRLRQPQLFKQHCRPSDFDFNEYHPAAAGWRCGGLGLWDSDVCRRLCAATVIWYV